MEKAAGSVADTAMPVMNLIMYTIRNDEVVPVIREDNDQAKQAPAKRIFLFALSTSMPMKIPAKAYDTL